MLGAAVAAVALVTTTAWTAAAAPVAPASGTAPAHHGDPVAEQLQSALDAVVAAGASGVVLRVDDGQHSYRLASGKARLDPPRPMAPGAEVRIGSITKTFVSTMALQLVAEHRLSLDDTVQKWQPGLVPNADQITVRELLQHTSGLYNYTDDPSFLPQLIGDPLRAYTPRQLIAVSNAHPPLFAPGTGWSYSNTNYVVVGLILERVTHRPISALIQQRIVRPLRLAHTFFPEISPDIPGYHAHGYLPPSLTGDGWLDITRISPTWAWAAGAVVSNVDDMRAFYRALLGGRLLPPAQLAQMETTVPATPGLDYGLGLFHLQTPCGPILGHDGGVPGYVTIAYNDPSGERGATLTVTTEPDQTIAAPLQQLALDAVCRALGQQPPPTGTPAAAGPTIPQLAPRVVPTVPALLSLS